MERAIPSSEEHPLTTAIRADPLPIREAARRLGIHPNSLRRAERERRIPSAKREPVSGERYYTEADIETLRQYLFAT